MLRLLVLLPLLLLAPAHAQRRRSRPSIVGEVAKNTVPVRETQCNFGNQTFEIDQKWKPNLGPPVGLLVCVRCECVAANRKSRVVTRVKCRNIRHDCPKPTCDKPVSLPGRCCKTCPGQEDSVLEEDLVGRKISRKGEQGRKIYSLVSHPKSTTSTPRPVAESMDTEVGTGVVMEDQENNDVASTHKCYYEGNIFEDGSQWRAQHQDCQMCSCQLGRIKCHDILCPETSCAEPVVVPGECCPSCPGNSSISMSSNSSSTSRKECLFEGDKKMHAAGTKWHPYLPPFGFDRCSLCTCDPGSLQIECKRSVTCPPLMCEESEAFRENPMDCCKRCPAVSVRAFAPAGQQGDQRTFSGLEKGPNELLASGGCKFKGRVFANGDNWHPMIGSYGEIKCVKCHCKDSKQRCRHTRCPVLTCAKKITSSTECCPKCAE